MADAKEIQNRIKSIQDTMKITKAMYMMSSMNLRKAKQKLENTEPYFYGLQEELKDILLHFPNMEHLYFDNRGKDKAETLKKRAIIVVSGDKGMAGAYNHNIIKEAQSLIDETPQDSRRIMIVGESGRQYFRGQGYNLEPEFNYSASNPSIHRARVITEHIFRLYDNEEIDEVYVVYTRMINSLVSQVETVKLMPLMTRDFVEQELTKESKQEQINNDWYTIHPSPAKVLDKLAHNYVTGFMYGVLVEGSSSEENARMMAMKSATDNAQAMLSELSVEYNRVRQSAITQEITEVIGGAKSLKKKKGN